MGITEINKEKKEKDTITVSFELERTVVEAFGFLGLVGSIELFAQTIVYTRIQDLLKQMGQQNITQETGE